MSLTAGENATAARTAASPSAGGVCRCWPRVGSVGNNEHEVTLDSYALFAEAEGIVAGMLAGISTRRYPMAPVPVGACRRTGRHIDVEVGGVAAVRDRDRRTPRRTVRLPARGASAGRS